LNDNRKMKRNVCVRSSFARRAFGLALGMALAGEFAIAPDISAQTGAPAQNQSPSASASDDQTVDSLLVKAQADVDNKDYAAAAEKYEIYLTQRPQDAQIHFQLGYCYTALQKMDEARAEYQNATELDNQMAPAFLNLGLAELTSDPGAAVAPLRRAVELMPDEERPKVLLATALAHSGKTDEAIAQYQAAETINANDFHLHIGFGEALLHANRDKEAELEFRAAVAINASDPGGHLGLGECLLAEQIYPEAADELGVYLKAQPADNKVREMRAKALIQAGKYDEGMAELKRAGSDAPTDFDSLMLQYGALMDEKRYDDAQAVLVKAEAVAPQNPMVHSMLGQAYAGKKDYVDAVREYQAALKISPRDRGTLVELASAEYMAKDYTDTLQAIDLLSQEGPVAAPTLFVRADCYDKLGKKPEALDAYERFLAANTDNNTDMYFAAAERARDLRKELGKKQK
jgi:tetratricopeptide (TPR) repeat protein